MKLTWTKEGDAWNSDRGFYIERWLGSFVLKCGDDHLGDYNTLQEAQEAAEPDIVPLAPMTTNTPKGTPVLWEQGKTLLVGDCSVSISTGDPVANAALIVKAVNNHSSLVKALRGMLNTHGMHGPCQHNSCKQCDLAYLAARAALKQVEEETT